MNVFINPAVHLSLMSEGTRALIVDSGKGATARLKELIKAQGVNTTAVPNGAKALKAFERDKGILLVIIDRGVQDVSKATLSQDLRELAKESDRKIYTILITGSASALEMKQALIAGVDDFLAEPYDDETLVARIQVGLGLLDGMRHGASSYERHRLVTNILAEHVILREIASLLDFAEKNLEKGVPRSITEWCVSAAFLIDFDVHVAKETAYIDKFQQRVSQEQAKWFADISRATFESLQEQHDHLERLGESLRRDLANYIKVKDELAPLVKSFGSLEVSLQIGDRDDELEGCLEDIKSRVEEYYVKRKGLISSLRKSLRDYIKFIPEHFELEEKLFFPFSSKYLTEDDLGYLSRVFEGIEARAGRDRLRKEKETLKKMTELVGKASAGGLQGTAGFAQ